LHILLRKYFASCEQVKTKRGKIMKRMLMVFALTLAVATMMAPVSASAALYTDRTAWEAAVGTFGSVDLPQAEYTTLASYASIGLPAGGFFNFDNPLQRLNYPTSWNTWNPSGSTVELLYFNQEATTLNASFYPDGVSGPISAFGFEAEPFVYGFYNISLYLASGGQMIVQDVDGQGGAKFFGWAGEDVIGFSIWSETGSGGFAMGRFVEGTAVPEAGTMLLLGSGLVGLVGYRRMKRMN